MPRNSSLRYAGGPTCLLCLTLMPHADAGVGKENICIMSTLGRRVQHTLSSELKRHALGRCEKCSSSQSSPSSEVGKPEHRGRIYCDLFLPHVALLLLPHAALIPQPALPLPRSLPPAILPLPHVC